MTITYGVHSEVGKLRRVLVDRPGAALTRLTPSNCHELLFDDVIWVKQARIEHMTFVDAIRYRGAEVVFLREALAETMQDREARRWLLERRINENTVGVGLADDLRAALMEMDADALSLILMGGMSKAELPVEPKGAFAPVLRPEDFILPPLPNHLFTRDTSCWIHGGVTLNPMRWNARKLETLNLAAIYGFHPDFRDADFPVWWGNVDHDFGPATLEGGDVMPVGNGVVLVGMGERTTPHAVGLLARALFAQGAAERVIACRLPVERASMHLDTVFTFCDRDLVTVFPDVAGRSPAITRSNVVFPQPLGPSTARSSPSGRSREISRSTGVDRRPYVALRPRTDRAGVIGVVLPGNSPGRGREWSPRR